MTTITLTAEDFQFLTAFVTMMIFAVTLFCALPSGANKENTAIARLQNALGATRWPTKWFVAVAVCWAVLALSLFGGLIATIGMIVHQLFFAADFTTNRIPLIQLAALTATLGAVVALPFTVIRLKLTQQQTETAKAALFNTKITEAAADLHAQRQISKKTGVRSWETLWEDDITRRNAAIDRLEGLVREEPHEAVRVSRLLSVYVRELSKAYPAKLPPDKENVDKIQDWAGDLKVQRSDMQNAVQVLGRLAVNAPDYKKDFEIDLRGANLQSMDLRDLNFEQAKLMSAELQGANLYSAELQGANLSDAKLQGANLSDAKLQGANFYSAELQGAKLMSAELQWANLSDAELQGANLMSAELQWAKLMSAGLRGANLMSAELQGAKLSDAKLQGANLSDAKLQGANLSDAKLQWAKLSDAELQGADLSDAKLQGANLSDAKLQGADLSDAKLKGANLMDSELQGANLSDAELQGAKLTGAKLKGAKLMSANLDQKSNLTEANLLGASVRFVDFTNVPQITPHLRDVFGDGSVTLPPDTSPPPYWPQKKDLSYEEFHAKWRAFAASKGVHLPD
ncbi:pentapeptide repeat-containing protein [Shimia sp. R10_1]|uniref:pentapeptide repeat-containing protein n=1 Tax=Shimia sp. R10_1 TaxID=2821095 RepID=UPI001ADA7B47|nr:pentapeptide repeat-containing protein [Shimia sp. R10_1]MBO9471943.1 pentapeptide repeat-containing protein [Shimia sp. R10_1]